MWVINDEVSVPRLDWFRPSFAFANKNSRIVGCAFVDHVNKIFLAIVEQERRQPQELGRISLVAANADHVMGHSFIFPNIYWSISVWIAV